MNSIKGITTKLGQDFLINGILQTSILLDSCSKPAWIQLLPH